MLISSIIECIMILVVIPLGYSDKGEGNHKLWTENSEDINSFDRSIFTPEILSNILSGLVSISRSIPNEKCQSEVIEYLDKLSNFKLWAVQMFDATSKFPMGVLQGAAYNLGNFDECLDVDNGANITGRYCLAKVEFNSLKRRASDAGTAWEKLRASNDRMKMRRNVFYHGICFPSSCGASDVEYWLNTVLTTFQSSTQTKFRVEVSESMCQKKDELSEPLNVSQIVWLCIFMYVIVIIWSTLSDLPLKNNCEELQKEMTCKRSFSLLRNWRQLTKQVDHDGDQFIACIDGLRVYTLIIIIIGHRGEAITSGPLINGNAVEQLANALVVLSSTAEDREIEVRISVGLTPAYMTVVAFEAWFLYDMSSGPLWKNKAGRERDNCLNNWWTNALHINNYVQAEFPISLWLGWVFSPLVAVAIIAMGYEFYQPSLHLGRFGNALYSGMHRTTFGACISFIIVACATGNGGVVARILEWKMLRPFSRLSYSVFLVHTVVQMVHYAAIRSPEYMNNTTMVCY
uniref:Nose resistant-to-fluoxetine protein N-terminal domain-containing protein n=1 Tax=Timema shepardi TaxID=629360 RepID=A0A7R9ATR4_TIMSH|nr:unnamed protein product [Timema shepardi]